MDTCLTGRRRRFALFVSAILLVLFSWHHAAAIECYQCHGTSSPPDYRPLDALARTPSTGGFRGDHRTHMGQGATPAACATCHPGSAEYTAAHRNGVITVTPVTTGSPLTPVYRNGTTAFPQSSNPKLSTCRNVNCHFERETPPWGTPRPDMAAACGVCHGSPPSGGDTGAAGSHGAHNRYFPGPGGCARCHSDHFHEPAPFAHATSGGRRQLVVTLLNTYTSAGNYSGPIDDYLPRTQTNTFGGCDGVYCHSQGTSVSTFAPNVAPEWGTPLPGDCSGCHGGDHQSATPMQSGSHTRHMGQTGYGQYTYDCSTCHSATTAMPRLIANPASHTNQQVDVVMKPFLGGTYSASGHPPGPLAGQCQNVYCHSNVQPNGGVGTPNSFRNPTWGSAGSIRCGDCHEGDGSHNPGGGTMASGSHSRHLEYPFASDTATKCAICHKYGTEPFQAGCAGSMTGCHSVIAAKHANGQVNVRIDAVFGNMSAYEGSPTPGDGYSDCLNTYCHSNGTSMATGRIAANNSPRWGSGALSCTSCHGYPPGYGNGSPKANSHQKHGQSCSRCHYGTTTDGATITDLTHHVNKSIDVIQGPDTAFTYSFAPEGSTCSAISCHGGGSATWGTKVPCTGCHDVPPATPGHLVHFTGTAEDAGYGDTRIAANYSPNASGYLMNCGNCHPLDQNKHGNGIVEVELYNASAPDKSLKALSPASAVYTNGTTVHTDSRGMTYTNGTCSNIYCHSYTQYTTPVGCDSSTEGGSRYCDDYALANLQVTRIYRSPVWNSKLPNDCTGCHANGPRSTYLTNDGMTGDSHSWGDPWGYEQGHFNKSWFDMDPITCNFCHNDTIKDDSKWWRTTPYPYYTMFSSVRIANFSKHVNGTRDVAFEKSKPWTMVRADWYGNITRTDFPLTDASYAPETKTCSNVSCHQLQPTVKWGTPYRGYRAWYGVDYQCKQCHSM